MKNKIRQVAYIICDFILDTPPLSREVTIVKSIRSSSMYVYCDYLGKIRISDHENDDCEYDHQILVLENSNVEELIKSFENKYYESNKVRY